MMNEKKVFGIGFHKTGTTSLAEALKVLGYSVTGPNGVDDPDIEYNLMPMAMKLAQEYDAFQDNPWPIVFKEMDEAFPRSKFILTIREEDQWIKSVCKHFGRDSTPMRKYIYGQGHPQGNENLYLKRYRKHNEDVAKYFAGRQDDLLIMDITKGDGWEKLCEFLGKEAPSIPFPHENQARNRNQKFKLFRKLYKKIKTKFIKLYNRIT